MKMYKTMNNNRSFKSSGFAALLLAVLISVGLAGCVASQPPMVRVSKSAILTGSDAQNITMTVMSNVGWTASSNSSWCTISPASGNGTKQVQVMIEACAATQERSAVITVSTDGSNSASATINVTQGAHNGILLVSPNDITVGSEASSVAFAISSNTSWSVSSVSSWASVDKSSGNGNGMVRVSLSENTSHSEDRTANIVVIAGEGNERFTGNVAITQLSRPMAVLNVTSSGLNFSADGGAALVPVVTNITGEVSASCDFAWCDATYANGVVSITCQPNTDNASRDCVVNVYGNVEGVTVCKQIEVYQSGVGSPELVLLKNNISLNSFSGNQGAASQGVVVGFIPVTKGTSVSVAKDYPSWISDVKVDATNDLITFDVCANEAEASRCAVLSVIATLGSESVVYPVNVTQRGVGVYSVTISSASLSAGAEGGVLNTDIFVNAAQATVSAYCSDADWAKVECSPTVNSFGVSASVAITVDPNTSAESRSATILVPAKAGDQMVYGVVTVLQAGVNAPEVKALASSIILPKEGARTSDNLFIGLSGADDKTTLTAVVPVEWLTATFSADKNSVIFAASANPGASARTTQIAVVAEKGGETQLIPVEVKQNGTGSADLIIAQTEYMAAQPGEVLIMPIEPQNGTTYEVVRTPDWLATSDNAALSGIKATIAANPDAASREGAIVILANNGDDYSYYVINVTQKGLEAPDIALGQKEITIPRLATAGTEGYDVTVIGADASTTLKVTSDKPWVKGLANGAKTAIAIAAEENAASAKRSAVITVVATRGGVDQSLSFSVVQPGTGSAELRIAVMSYTFGPKAVSDFEIPVTALNGTAYSVASKPDFVTIAGDGTNVMRIDVASNENTVEPRSGVIVLKAVNGSDEVQYGIGIEQLGMNGPNVTASVSGIVVPREAITGTEGYDVALVGVDAATALKTSSSATWVEGVITAADFLSFKTEENKSSDKRTAVVSVIATRAGEEQVIPVQVTQPGTGNAELRLALPVYTFSYKPVLRFAVPVTMVSGTKYTVAAKPEWLTIEGGGTNVMLFSIPKNEVTDQRSGTVILRAENGDDETEYTIGVMQLGMDGPDVSLANDTIILPQKAISAADGYNIPMIGKDDETTVAFTYQYGWAIPSFSTDFDRIMFSSYENTASAKREVNMSVIATKGGQKQIINFHVIQLGTGSAALELAGNDYQFGYGAVSLFTIPVIKDNGTRWTYYSHPSWVTVAGEGSGNMKISLTANDGTGDSRTGDIILKATNGDDITFYTIKITQMGIGGPNVTALQTSITLPSHEVHFNYGYAFNLEGIDAATSVFAIESFTDFQWMRVQYDDVSKSVEIMAYENEAATSRTAQVTVVATKGDQTQFIRYLTVTQMGTGDPQLVFPAVDIYAAWNDTQVTIPFITVNSPNVVEVADVSDPLDMIAGDQIYSDYLQVDLNANETTSSRTATVPVLVANGTDAFHFYSITIHQGSAGGPIAKPVTDQVTIPNEAGKSAFVLLKDWSTSPASSITLNEDSDWYEATYSHGVVNVLATAVNKTSSPRSESFSIIVVRSGETAVQTVKVTQPGNGGIVFNTDKAIYGAVQAGETITARYTSNELTTAKVIAAPEWITAPAAGTTYSYNMTGDGSIPVTVAANDTPYERTGYILMLLINGLEQSFYEIGIVQPGTEGPKATLLYDSVDMPQAEVSGVSSGWGINGDYYYDYEIDLKGIDASTTVTANSNVDWLTIAAEDGYGSDYYIALNATANNHVEARTGQIGIVVEKNGQFQYFTVTVTQRGTGSPDLLMDVDNFHLDWQAQTPQIEIYPTQNTIVSVYADPKDAWVSDVSVGSKTLSFQVAENLTEYPRNTYFVLSVKRGDEVIYKTVRVYQGCKTAPYMELPAGITYMSAAGENRNLTVTNINNVKRIRIQSIEQGDENWLSVTAPANEDLPEGGPQAIVLNAVNNPHSAIRTATVTVEYGNDVMVQQAEFKVVQYGLGFPSLDFDVQDFYLDFSAQSDVPVPVTDVEGTMVLSYDPEDFLTATVAGNAVTFSVTENDTEYPRNSFFVVSETKGDVTIYRTIRVYQGAKTAPYMEIAPSLHYGTPALAAQTVPIITKNVQNVRMQYNSGADWLTVGLPTIDGDGSHTISLTAAENTASANRSATVVLEYGNELDVEQTTFTVTQAGVGYPVLDFAVTDVRLDAEAHSSVTIPVQGDGTASVVGYSGSWIHDGIFNNAQNPVSFTFSVDANKTMYPRYGYILVSIAKGDVTSYRTITVYQGAYTAPYLALATNVAYLGANTTDADATQTIVYNTINAKRVRIQSVSASWLEAELNPAFNESTQSGSIVITATATNTSTSPRTAYVVLEYGNDIDVEQAVLAITQNGQTQITLEMDLYEFFLTPDAQSATAAVRAAPTATAWAIDDTYKASWLTLTKAADGKTIQMNVTENDTEYPRNTYFVIYYPTTNYQTVRRTIRVFQGAKTAPYLGVDPMVLYDDNTVAGRTVTFTLPASKAHNVNSISVKGISFDTGDRWIDFTTGTVPVVTLPVEGGADGSIAFHINSLNTASDMRTATITVEYGNDIDVQETKMAVVQSGVGDPSLAVVPSATVVWDANAVTLPVIFDGTLSSAENVGWITNVALPVASGGNMTITLDDNNSYTREGYVNLTVTKGDRTTTQSVLIRQTAKGAPYVTITNLTSNMAAAGGNATFTIIANANCNSGSFVLKGVAYSLSATGWLSGISVLSTSVSAVVAANAAAADRYADITIQYGNDNYVETAVLRVYQAGTGAPVISTPSTLYYLDEASHTGFAIPVTFDGTLAVESSSMPGMSGLALPGASGGNMTFDLSENASQYDRNGYIVLRVTKGGVTAYWTVNITQYADVSPHVILGSSVGYYSYQDYYYSMSFTVRNLTYMSYDVSDNWISVTSFPSYNPGGSKTLQLHLAQNTSGNTRYGWIRILYGDAYNNYAVYYYITQYDPGD